MHRLTLFEGTASLLQPLQQLLAELAAGATEAHHHQWAGTCAFQGQQYVGTATGRPQYGQGRCRDIQVVAFKLELIAGHAYRSTGTCYQQNVQVVRGAGGSSPNREVARARFLCCDALTILPLSGSATLQPATALTRCPAGGSVQNMIRTIRHLIRYVMRCSQHCSMAITHSARLRA